MDSFFDFQPLQLIHITEYKYILPPIYPLFHLPSSIFIHTCIHRELFMLKLVHADRLCCLAWFDIAEISEAIYDHQALVLSMYILSTFIIYMFSIYKAKKRFIDYRNISRPFLSRGSVIFMKFNYIYNCVYLIHDFFINNIGRRRFTGRYSLFPMKIFLSSPTKPNTRPLFRSIRAAKRVITREL